MPAGVHLLSPQRSGPSTKTAKLIEDLVDAGLVQAYTPLTGCCWIDLARGELLHEFLRVGYDTALWVDADIWCSTSVVRSMIEVGQYAPVVAMTYPRRADGKLCVEVMLDQTPIHIAGRRALRIYAAGLGLCLVSRRSMSDLVGAHEGLRMNRPSEPTVSYVNPFVHAIEDGEYHGDDRIFFRRLAQAGIPVVTLLDAPVTHDGATSTFTA